MNKFIEELSHKIIQEFEKITTTLHAIEQQEIVLEHSLQNITSPNNETRNIIKNELS